MAEKDNGKIQVKDGTLDKINNSVDILGIPIWNGNLLDATESIINSILSELTPRNRCISASGSHGLVYSKSNDDFARTLMKFEINLPDGMPLVWLGRLKGFREMKRCYGPKFFKEMLTKTSELPINHFFCGGNLGVAEELRLACEKKFKNNKIVGTLTPPFLELSQIEYFDFGSIAEKINRSGANIVWIGLSTPKQEIFALNLSKLTNVNYIVCVGAAFDFHTDNVTQAPEWLQNIGMEWFFRMCIEPKRLFRRYFEIVPSFLYFSIIDLYKENKY
jgi:N-acetylglucosaminyldiphosphoundecaprenol N-acetyl-beta-D-mannosaminyltransferase